MDSSSPLSAACEVFGLNYILNIFGLSKVTTEGDGTELKDDVSAKSKANAEVVEINDVIVEQEVIVDTMEAKKVIADLLVQKEGQKSKKAVI